MSASGHYRTDSSRLMDHIESPPPIGTGSPWTVQGFRDHFFAVSQRSIGEVSDYNVHLPTDDLYDTHEIFAGPDGMVYFTQRMHDRVGRFTLDGRVEFFDLPEGSRPHGLRFSRTGGWYITLENFDEIVELSKDDGSIVATYSVAFDDPQIQGVVGPHGLAIDQQNRLWYAGRTSDVLGWVDPGTGEHQRFELPTRPEIAPNFDHEFVKSKASAPIYIDFDCDDNAWFVNLQANQIGRIDAQNQMSLFEIEGFDTNNTRPINVFQGPDGLIWVTIEGDNSPSAENTQQSLGGIARFDPSTETFEAYPQKLSKGAGGALGVKDNSVWFQYQEEALVRLMVDDSGRSDQQTFPLPDIGKRVMHRIAQGPDGNMWFTSLAADVVSRLVTDQQGLPVYGFDQTHTGDQYLSALPMEWTHLLQPESGYDSPDPLFLSPSAGDEVIATSRFWDRLTGQSVWTIDGNELDAWQSSDRYEWLGEDFRVFDEQSDASGLIPVYRAIDADDFSLLWYTEPGSVDPSIHADSSVAWYAYEIQPVSNPEPESGNPVSNLYNFSLGNHLFSSNQNEIDILTGSGWVNKGTVYFAPEEATAQVFRFYVISENRHFYTALESERDIIIGDQDTFSSWEYEGGAFSAYSTNDYPEEAIAVVRYFNLENGNHVYSTSTFEQGKLDQDSNWLNEGIAWYGNTLPTTNDSV